MGIQNKIRKEYRPHLTEETIRIRTLRSFGNIKAGDLGGFIENERNLSILIIKYGMILITTAGSLYWTDL